MSGYLVWQSFIDVLLKFCPFPPNKRSCYKTCNCASSFVKWRERYLPQGSVRQLELESDSARSFYFLRILSVYWKVRKVSAFSRHQPRTGVFLKYLMCQLYFNVSKGLFTWSGGTRSSGVGFFCFVSARAWKQKKPTPLDRGPPLHVNRVLVVNCMCCISILFRVTGFH